MDNLNKKLGRGESDHIRPVQPKITDLAVNANISSLGVTDKQLKQKLANYQKMQEEIQRQSAELANRALTGQNPTHFLQEVVKSCSEGITKIIYGAQPDAPESGADPSTSPDDPTSQRDDNGSFQKRLETDLTQSQNVEIVTSSKNNATEAVDMPPQISGSSPTKTIISSSEFISLEQLMQENQNKKNEGAPPLQEVDTYRVETSAVEATPNTNRPSSNRPEDSENNISGQTSEEVSLHRQPSVASDLSGFGSVYSQGVPFRHNLHPSSDDGYQTEYGLTPSETSSISEEPQYLQTPTRPVCMN